MVQRTRSCHVSTSPNGDEAAAKNKNGAEISRRKGKEKDKHWDFLDEIEAPMWVDLTQECQSGYQYMDDEWFSISHPFHHCSAKELISAFCRIGEGWTNSDLCGPEQFSPKLPSSVSRSRGKDYRSREWGQKNYIATFDLQQSVKESKVSSASLAIDMVSQNKKCNGRPQNLAGSQSESIGERSCTEITGEHDQPLHPFRDQKCSIYISSRGEESKLTSTTTSEGSGNQQQKSFEVSSQLFVQTSRLLSELKISLRKNCVTRQASRVQVTGRRQSEVQNSSSSKSSVGSSSSSLGCDVKNLRGRQNKDSTSKYVTGVSKAYSDNITVAKSSKAPALRSRDITTKPNSSSQSFALPSINQENAKGKVQSCNVMVQKVLSDVKPQSLQRRVLVPCGVNERSPLAVNTKVKEKAIATSDQIPGVGKENWARKVAMSQKLSSRVKATKNTEQVPKSLEGNCKTVVAKQNWLAKKHTKEQPEKFYKVKGLVATELSRPCGFRKARAVWIHVKVVSGIKSQYQESINFTVGCSPVNNRKCFPKTCASLLFMLSVPTDYLDS